MTFLDDRGPQADMWADVSDSVTYMISGSIAAQLKHTYISHGEVYPSSVLRDCLTRPHAAAAPAQGLLAVPSSAAAISPLARTATRSHLTLGGRHNATGWRRQPADLCSATRRKNRPSMQPRCPLLRAAQRSSCSKRRCLCSTGTRQVNCLRKADGEDGQRSKQ